MAVGVNGRKVVGPLGVAHVEDSFCREEHGVASVPCRHDTVEHVNAAFDGFEDVDGCSDAHEVAWAVGGKNVVDNLNHLIHHLRRFAYGQSADSVAFGVELSDEAGTLLTQVFVRAALYDREERLRIAVVRFRLAETFHAATKPAVGQVEASPGIGVVGCAWRALVESHHDVGADSALDVHDALRREEVAASVDV